MKKPQDSLRQYKKAVNDLAKEFLATYYPDEKLGKGECYWIGDEVGGVLHVADMFFGVELIFTAMTLKPTFDQLYDYYHYEMALHKPINIEYPLKDFMEFTEAERGKLIGEAEKQNTET